MRVNSNVVVLGHGFLGSEFARHGYEVFDRVRFNWPGSLDCLDGYDYVVNCIGNADTRQCENASQWDDVYDVNSNLVRVLSDYCHAKGKQFVHISTGCVYDQNNFPQREDSFTSSHCRYVVSKLAGEYFCRPGDLILRPRLYFGGYRNKNNLFEKLPGFKYHLNEINSYTSTRTIVEACAALIDHGQSGVFNVAQKGYASMQQVCHYLRLPAKPVITGSELQRQQGVALVNNILDITKLERFYKPRDLYSELGECWKLYQSQHSKNDMLVASGF